jgi:hypothetical protein
MLPMDLKTSIQLIPKQLNYTYSDVLKQFEVEKILFEEMDKFSEVNVEIKLKRIFSYHLTNTYLPTLTLLVIAEITLYFDESKTEMAIGLSLTILLVMYTMYQSISESLIKTAYLKMIDYWLLFCLLVPFLIFMIEIYWLLQKTQNLNATAKGWIIDEKQKISYRKQIRYIALGITILFISIYIFVAIFMRYEII